MNLLEFIFFLWAPPFIHAELLRNMFWPFREKKKREERTEPQKANEAIKKCLGEYLYSHQ